MSQPVRVLVVEDNEVFRDALELLFGLRSDVEVVAAVADGQAAVEVCRTHRPDVVLMDFRMPGLDGVEATARLRRTCPAAAVICLTASVAEGDEEALLEAGAVACLRKDQELDAIVAAVLDAARAKLHAPDG